MLVSPFPRSLQSLELGANRLAAWHKLYSSAQRRGIAEKAEKDRRQAMVLGAVLAEHDPTALEQALQVAPRRTLSVTRPLLGRLARQIGGRGALQDVLQEAGRR